MSSFNLEDIKKYLREKVMEQLDISRSMEDYEVKEVIDDCIMAMSKEQYINTWEKDRIAKEIFCSIRRLDILQELIEDSEVTEIMVNGTEGIFVERGGCNEKVKVCFQEKEKLEDVIQQIVAKSNRIVNESNPIVDARLENGSRVNVVLAPVAINGPILTIRRFPKNPIDMKRLIEIHSITKEASEFLKKLVIAGYNIFISGGTGSGKTTFLNALSDFVPRDERIITIEDSAELQIQGIDNLVRLETRNANVEGCQEITIRDLIKTSLRMRPDRIIVGEVRGAEAIDMIQALNTGHDGSLSTGHANSAKDMISRLETMILMGMNLPLEAIRRQISSGIDIIIHLGRLRDKSRKVLQIAEVIGYEDGEVVLNSLFEYGEEEGYGTLIKCGELTNTQKLIAKGL
ncbi:MAG: CpaF family protein [Lachnospiraceae bacterium]|nr:CpaF family protein [Lachnospiraceae bacterium]